jgi:hypothetical protein
MILEVHPEMLQGSDAWHLARKGKVTASRYKEILTPTGKFSKSSRKLALRLVAETWVPEYSWFDGNRFTDWGTEQEAPAREEFTRVTGIEVEQVGFVENVSRYQRIVGASPDALIRSEGEWLSGVELKCPAPDTLIQYHLNGTLPDEYRPQVLGTMAVCGFDHYHFAAYFPGMPLFHIVVKREDHKEYIESILVALDEFVILYAAVREEVRELFEKLRGKQAQLAAA